MTHVELLVVVAKLKAIFFVASIALARGDMVFAILISVVFSLAELGAKPVDQMTASDSRAVSQSDDRGRGPSPVKP